DLRKNAPKTLGGIAVKEIRDYENQVSNNLISGETTAIDLPKSDVLQFVTVDGDVISARPSGTEPKIKFYCSVKESLMDKSQYEAIQDRKSTRLNSSHVKISYAVFCLK